MSCDYFALLEEPRRPWLDPELLKAKFFSLSGRVHPDRVHDGSPEVKQEAQNRSTELNTAYTRLKEPKERIRHLLELERGSRPVDLQQIPSEMMDRFMTISQVLREADAFLRERAGTSSPLLKVALFERGQETVDRLQGLQQGLNAWREQLVAELKRLDQQWEGAQPRGAGSREAVLQQLESLYRRFGFQERWSSQVQERMVQITLSD